MHPDNKLLPLGNPKLDLEHVCECFSGRLNLKVARDIPVKFMEMFNLSDGIDVNFGVCGDLVDVTAEKRICEKG